MQHRYVNCCTSSTLPEDSCIGSTFRVNIFITLVFLELIRSPVCAAICSNLVVFSCICLWLCDSNATSSAKSRSSSCDSKLHCMPVLFPSVTSLITQSIMSKNRNGVSRHPCRPPVTTSPRSGAGREFQVDGPATAKLRGPYRSVVVAGTARSPRAAERR